jgi:hypothetical protein
MERAALVEQSKGKPIPPFTLDESLTFYCPQENLEAFNHPVVAEWHRFMTTEYSPALDGGLSMMLILPCTKDKPYIMSREHLAVNSHLLMVGFEPLEDALIPEALEQHLPPGYDRAVLNNRLLRRGGLTLHRCVISEPLGLVPYEFLYYYGGRLSPASRYDDPGLFEHRPNTVCPWRADYTGIEKGTNLGWGDNEKLAYVQVHNRLVRIIATALKRLEPTYSRIVAYVSPGLTHRSFLSSREEKKASGIRTARRIAGQTYVLEGVNDLHPHLVTVVPTKEERQGVFKAVEARLRAEGQTVTKARVRGYFARGGGGATPLALPESLEILDRYLAPWQGSIKDYTQTKREVTESLD